MNPFDPSNPDVPSVGQSEQQIQLPPLRTWVVTASSPNGHGEDVAIEAHALQHDGGVLSFLVYSILGGQPVGQIRYMFAAGEWYRVRELVVTNAQTH